MQVHLTYRLLLVFSLFLSCAGCAGTHVATSPPTTETGQGGPPRVAADDLPRRLVLALDGIPYGDVYRLQQVEKRCLAGFRPVTRNISTFPSLSDVAWADIFHTAPPEGYQRYHFSIRHNRIMGGTITELVQRQVFERRMHFNPDTPTKHLMTYLFAESIARDELERTLEQFWAARGIRSFYAYSLATDSLLHTDGDIDGFLCWLDARLEALQTRYRARTGRPLEIVILSDHGNNHAAGGKLIEVRDHLEEHGLRVTHQLRSPGDVVFTTSGILASAAVYTRPEDLVPTADVFLETEGVDLLTYVDHLVPGTILVRRPDGRAARIRRHPTVDAYAYLPLEGDPLEYREALEALRKAGKAGPDGFVAAGDWLEATSTLAYPAAPERIWRGHFLAALNAAPLLVSLRDGYEITYGLVKTLSHVTRRGGTHGNLGAGCSNGVVLTNFLELPVDVTTNRVGDLLGFQDMFDFKEAAPGTALEDARVIGYDRRAGFIDEEGVLSRPGEVFVNLWDPRIGGWVERHRAFQLRFVVTRERFLQPDTEIADRVFPARTLPRSPDLQEYRVPLSLLVTDYLTPGSYRLRVSARWQEAQAGRVRREALFSVRFFADVHGQVIAY